jgi:hypothetical protein
LTAAPTTIAIIATNVLGEIVPLVIVVIPGSVNDVVESVALLR